MNENNLDLLQRKAAATGAAQLIMDLQKKENRSLTKDEIAEMNAKISEAEGIDETIKAAARMSQLAGNGGGSGIQVRDLGLEKPWWGEAVIPANETADQRRERICVGGGNYLRAVRNAALNPGNIDPRLQELNKRVTAPSGSSEQVPADGGFLVYPDFSSEIVKIAHDTGVVYTRGRKIPLSESTNAMKIPGVDEQSRKDGSRWGGVRMYWMNEADALTGSRPKFRMIDLTCKKLGGLYYATDELLNDARALGSIIMQGFGEELGFKMDDAAINGNGAGMPQGILNSAALITVLKESGQTATTLNFLNVTKMWYRMWYRSRANAVWFVNTDVEQQLLTMSLAVGSSGGSSVVAGVAPWQGQSSIYTPPGVNGNVTGMLLGRPVFPIEQCPSLGTAGDIILADMSQWLWCDKGDVQQATSMHVRFLNDEMTFRWIYRTDGQSMWHTALTPFNGSNTLSPFVNLQAR